MGPTVHRHRDKFSLVPNCSLGSLVYKEFLFPSINSFPLYKKWPLPWQPIIVKRKRVDLLNRSYFGISLMDFNQICGKSEGTCLSIVVYINFQTSSFAYLCILIR